MTEARASSLVPFAWVYKRDGRLVPFDADKISRALFAATESLGHPDAFMARELTDSTLHFLAAEASGTTPATTDLAELVVKVVRELGQPTLAQAFVDFARQRRERKREDQESHESHELEEKRRGSKPKIGSSPSSDSFDSLDSWYTPKLVEWVEEVPPVQLTWRAGEAVLRDYASRHVFTRDLLAAQADGLLSLTGLEAPLELAGGVLAPATGQAPDVVEAIEEARQWAGSFVAIDGPEFRLGDASVPVNGVPAYLRELKLGLRLTHLRGVLNLNGRLPPSWAEELAEGPLFKSQRRAVAPERLASVAEALLEQALASATPEGELRVDWHLAELDFLPPAAPRLVRLTRLALNGADLAFVFDRPRRPVSLAEGTDRKHPAVLLAVGLHLPRLAEIVGSPPDPALFLQKLGSLARLALSAAVQKREFLRRHSPRRPGMTRGFLLERARLVVTPVGLEAVTQQLLGQGLCPEGPGLDFARQVVQQLHMCLHRDGQAYQLETCLETYPPPDDRRSRIETWAPGQARSSILDPRSSILDLQASVGGLVLGEGLIPVKNQFRASKPLQALAEMGTVVLLLPEESPPTPEEAAQLLRFAWQQTEVIRVRFLRVALPLRQLTAPWVHEATQA